MGSTEPLAVLRDVARHVRKPVRKCAFVEFLCKTELAPYRPWEIKAIPGDLFHHEVRFKQGPFQVSARVNDEWMSIWFKLAKAVFAKSDLRQVGSYIRDALQPLNWNQKEDVRGGLNGFWFYLKPQSGDEVLRLVERISELTSGYVHLEVGPDFHDLPSQFHPLIPLLKRWSDSDDADRREKLSGASRRTLEKPVNTGRPLLTAINSYLDSFKAEPLPEVATILGSFAECICEAKLILDQRTKTD